MVLIVTPLLVAISILVAIVVRGDPGYFLDENPSRVILIRYEFKEDGMTIYTGTVGPQAFSIAKIGNSPGGYHLHGVTPVHTWQVLVRKASGAGWDAPEDGAISMQVIFTDGAEQTFWQRGKDHHSFFRIINDLEDAGGIAHG